MGSAMLVLAVALAAIGVSQAALEQYMMFTDRQNLVANSAGYVVWTELRQGTSYVVRATPSGSLTNLATFNNTVAIRKLLIFDTFVLYEVGPPASANIDHSTTGTAPSAVYWSALDVLHTYIVSGCASLDGTRSNGAHVQCIVNEPQYRGGAVYEVPTSNTGPPMLLFRVPTGAIRDLAWSPDSTKLAFANDRGDHGFLGLFVVGYHNLFYAPASVDTDRYPVWSPSGAVLAWLRFRVPIGDTGYTPLDMDLGNRGPDFAVMVTSPVVTPSQVYFTGTRELFLDTKYGYPVMGYGRRALMWAGQQTLIFGTESVSGWKHAVALTVQTGRVAELAPGNCEDLDWITGGDGWVYLASNCQNIDSRGVERVHIDNMGKREVVSQSGTYRLSGMASSGMGMAIVGLNITLFQSEYNAPSSVVMVSFAPKAYRVIAAGKSVGDTFVLPKPVTFASGEMTIHGQVFLPPNGSANGAGIIYTHGGSERQTFCAFHFSTVYAQQYAVNQWLASKGYVVFSVNYRSGVGYGHDFRVCPGCMFNGGAEYKDVLNAAKWLATAGYGVQQSRIGIWGISYGGLNALQAVTRNSNVFSAAVAGAGIFNWITESRYFMDTGLSQITTMLEPRLYGFRSLPVGPEPNAADSDWMLKVQKKQMTYLGSSPAGHLKDFVSPTLIYQGDADQEVAFQETIGLVRACRALGKTNLEVRVFPDETHGLSLFTNQVAMMSEMGAFFDRHLTTAS